MEAIIILTVCLLGIFLLVAYMVINAIFNLLAWIGEKISERGLGGLVVLILILEILLYILDEFISGRVNKSILLCALL